MRARDGGKDIKTFSCLNVPVVIEVDSVDFCDVVCDLPLEGVIFETAGCC